MKAWYIYSYFDVAVKFSSDIVNSLMMTALISNPWYKNSGATEQGDIDIHCMERQYMLIEWLNIIAIVNIENWELCTLSNYEILFFQFIRIVLHIDFWQHNTWHNQSNCILLFFFFFFFFYSCHGVACLLLTYEFGCPFGIFCISFTRFFFVVVGNVSMDCFIWSQKNESGNKDAQ